MHDDLVAYVQRKPDGPDALTLALLRSCGISTDNVKWVEYSHTVGEMPEITVNFVVTHPTAGFTETVTQTWEMVEETRHG